jgi:hypothetical protein
MDLNIANYSIQELKNIISLPSIDYNHTDIQKNCENAIDIIRHDTMELTPKEHLNVILFFNKIKDKLIQHYFDTQIKQQTSRAQTTTLIQKHYPNYEKKYITQLINIDTQFRKQYQHSKSTDFMYELNEPIKNVVSMKLASLEVPNVWKSINKYSNTFRILWKTTSPFIDVSGDKTTVYERILQTTNDVSGSTITIPEGNYSITNLVKSLKNLLNEQSIPINVVFDENLGKLVFTKYPNSTIGGASYAEPMISSSIDSTNLSFVLLFGNYNVKEHLTLGYKLGFRKSDGVYESKKNIYKDIYSKTSIVSYDTACIADTQYGAADDTYLFLCLNDFQYSVINSVITDNFIDNVLARIVITSDTFTVILDNNSDQIYKSREYSSPVTLKSFQIQLKDKYGKIVDINNENFNFSLEVNRLL